MSNNFLESLITPDTKIKVSSTLDKSVGKGSLVDNDPETCWTSQQGLPQFVLLHFPQPVVPKYISLTFQGGFVGTACAVHILPLAGAEARWQFLMRIHPEDVNRVQVFPVALEQSAADQSQDAAGTEAGAQSLRGVKGVKLVFEESSDFFGRITLYNLKIEGERSA